MLHPCFPAGFMYLYILLDCLCFSFLTNQLKSFKSDINLETEKRLRDIYAIKNVLGQNPAWCNKDRAHSCFHFFLSVPIFLSLSPSPSVLHLSFPLCPSSPLLFITPLIKPAHPERTEFRGGWRRERGRERGRKREMNEGKRQGQRGDGGMERQKEERLKYNNICNSTI